MTPIVTIQQDLHQSAEAIKETVAALVMCIEHGKLADSYTSDIQQISKATKTLFDFIERASTPPPDDGPEVAKSFASRLRHDTSTPVNAIRGYSEIILEETQDVADVKEYLRAIVTATDAVLASIAKITPEAWKE
jgi:signal transduction histidine kinase